MFVPDQVWIQDGLKGAGGISPSVTLPDWTIENWELKPLVYALAPRHQYSSYAFEFTASRNVEHYILKVILPLVLIVIISYAVFCLKKKIKKNLHALSAGDLANNEEPDKN